MAVLTREYPPDVYGGAGVHVEYLTRELATMDGLDVEVHPFAAYGMPSGMPVALGAMSVNVAMAAAVEGVDLVHSHTWYANLGGHLAALLYGVPHVMTSHSLEPLRPWKAEQLGGGYALSSWCERTAVESAAAVIAVSGAMRDDILAAYPAVNPTKVVVIHNGIDVDEYQPAIGTDHALLDQYGIPRDRPFALFVGRMTRQKGIAHLLHAARSMKPDHVVVAVAASPDTHEIGVELRALASEVRAAGAPLVWIEDVPPRDDVIGLLSMATAFVCPSVYEPFGLVNIEAMACGTAVVASAVGGIPEIVVHGETGLLVAPTGGRFAERLAAAITDVLDDPARAAAMGEAGRRRVLERFTWSAVAAQTAEVYRSLVA